MPSAVASSARGGRNSAPNTLPPACSADTRSISLTVIYSVVTSTALRGAIARFPSLPLVASPTLVEPLPRLRDVLGGGPRLFIKRDDAIAFAFGGNKVRKLAFVGARAQADGADTLITAGGVQSNHARVTAATAAKLGMRAILIANGVEPEARTANALLDSLLGAEI